MAFQVNRKKFIFEGNAYLVDVWYEDGKYNAYAQQIDVDEYIELSMQRDFQMNL